MAAVQDTADSQSTPPDARRSDEIAVLTKAMAVLTVLASDSSATVARICQETGVTKPTAYRILKTLESGGFAVRDEARREYSIGPALHGLARSLRSSSDLLQIARPHMEALNAEFNETVNIGVLNQGRIVYLDTVESAQRLRSTVEIAIRDFVHSTSLGKAILSTMPEDSARRILDSVELPALTDHTITNRNELMAQLAQFRLQGFAVDDEENEVGSRCVGAPIKDTTGFPVASISVSAPAHRMTGRTVTTVGRRLVDTCNTIGDLL